LRYLERCHDLRSFGCDFVPRKKLFFFNCIETGLMSLNSRSQLGESARDGCQLAFIFRDNASG